MPDSYQEMLKLPDPYKELSTMKQEEIDKLKEYAKEELRRIGVGHAISVTCNESKNEMPVGDAIGGLKYDSGKPRISLLPGLAIAEVMKVGEAGARKYTAHNYRRGMSVTRYIDAAYRHIFVEWLFKGIDNDEESGLSHLAHGAWNILAALEQMMVKPELDDRWKNEEPKR